MKKFIIIDSHSLIHRAFHAIPPLTTPSGSPIGAVYGFTTMILKILEEHRPDYVLAAFDRPEETFRKKVYKEYKAHRPPTQSDLIKQFAPARELLSKLKINILEKPGFEADDIIGTVVKKMKRRNLLLLIITGDLDMLQLVEDPFVMVETPKKGVNKIAIYNESAVKNRFGITPKQLTDYKGLVGDTSDNIPGIPGVGPKTATNILSKYKNIETAFEKMSPDDPFFKKIKGFKKQAIFSKKIATIKTDVNIDANLENFKTKEFSKDLLGEYFSALGFKNLIKRMDLPDKNTPSLFYKEKPLKEEAVVVYKKGMHKKILVDGEVLKIAFGWKQILKDLKKRGLFVSGPLFDIKIAAWLLNPEKNPLSINEVAKKYMKPPFKNTEEDIISLYKKLVLLLKENRLLKIFEEIEMPVVEILASMENKGISINKNKLVLLNKKIDKEINVLAKKIYKNCGLVFNINSPNQVAEVLFKKLKIRPPKNKTPTGKLKTNKGALEEIKEQHVIIPLILKYKEFFKIKTAFILPFIKFLDKNKKIHTNYIQTGTATGRIASEKPNLQNIPQESRWAKQLRGSFEPEKGKSFVSFDYSQLELRLLAHLSKDDALREVFKKGLDVHSLTAARVFGVSKNSVTKKMRRIGKILNFGIIYGMGPRTFSKTSGVDIEEAKKIIEIYFKTFPNVKIWQKGILKKVEKDGFITNLNGRRRWFFGGSLYAGEFERRAINMPIQSLGADIIKTAMINSKKILDDSFYKNSYKASLLLSIHDELLFEISDDILKETSLLLKKCMENAFDLSVPLVVSSSVGKNWGEMKMFLN